MMTIRVDNVHQALPEGCRMMLEHGIVRKTRNGLAKQLPEPLTTVYLKPAERVVFWPERDANPFFHFFECLWMMAGRNDVEWISQYNSKIDQFSDDGISFNGAYGYRWLHHFGFNQLQEIALQLHENPNCRRQVLTMWDALDLTRFHSKDVPCNTSAYFQRSVRGELDLMVTNRSNDLIWGAYGANAVHFSFLLERMSEWAAMPMGRYYHVSMNTHLYERHYELAEKLAQRAPKLPDGRHTDLDPYACGDVAPYPIAQFALPREWNADLTKFMEGSNGLYDDPFFTFVATPLAEAWAIFKSKKGEPDRIDKAIQAVSRCEATDWRNASIEWLLRRQ